MSFGYRSSFGLFVYPITDANGWGREVISTALAIQNLVWGIVAVFAGGLADRFGNVKVIVAGTIFYSLGMVLMSGVDSPWLLNTSAGLLVGAGIAGTSFGIVLPAMARAVCEEKRQWALGLGTAVGSMGQFVMVPAAQMLIDAYGWMTALNLLAGSALLMALLAMPLAPFSGGEEGSSAVASQTVPEALQEAMGHRSFLLLATGFFVCGFHVAFVTAHMPAFLTDHGFDPKIGAWSVAVIGLCNVVGAYLSGIWSGKLPKRHVLVFIYLGRAVTISAFLLFPLSLPSVFIFSGTMGFLWLATVLPTSGRWWPSCSAPDTWRCCMALCFSGIRSAVLPGSGWAAGCTTGAAATTPYGGWEPPLGSLRLWFTGRFGNAPFRGWRQSLDKQGPVRGGSHGCALATGVIFVPNPLPNRPNFEIRDAEPACQTSAPVPPPMRRPTRCLCFGRPWRRKTDSVTMPSPRPVSSSRSLTEPAGAGEARRKCPIQSGRPLFFH